ncbi:terminase family protein [Arthrobacter sp. GN70]|nr:terminase family protein [Arthrobacter sp. GN70]
MGKSTTLSTIALFEAATRGNITVLLVSAGEVASRRLLEECQALAVGSPLLRGSVLDDSKSLLTLSNGSRIISVPASQRQIRGWAIDLLVLDEAGFIDPEIWRAAEPAIIARPGSRVILVSTPWGGVDHFFRALWQRGMDAPSDQVESWHWPSSVSPLVDAALLEQIRQRETAEYFRREFLAEWTDDAGSYFSESEIMGAVADYRMCPPEDLESWFERPYAAAAGLDWGYAQDASAMALVSVLEDWGANRGMLGDDYALFVPWLEVRHGWPYSRFIDRVVETAGRYYLPVIASEVNGPGEPVTQNLREKAHAAGADCGVYKVWTDNRRKMSGFSKIKVLLQRNQLVLPRDPELLKQMRSLEFEQLQTGSLRIAVPERAGHDDGILALMQAVSSVNMQGVSRLYSRSGGSGSSPLDIETVTTSSGLVVPVQARPVAHLRMPFMVPTGSEKGSGW